MVKHLYINPSNFNELILSGVLIQMFKSDIEIHQSQELKFVQGPNVIEGNSQAILRFSNAYFQKKLFGRNVQQQAIITMVNGVCKDIEAKLVTQEALGQQLKAKIQSLDNFWNSKQNCWIKSRFIYCHINILAMSFRVQERHPQILLEFTLFVELRKLFIQKLMSKQALQAIFAHPKSKYQQFQLYPELQTKGSIQATVTQNQSTVRTLQIAQSSQFQVINDVSLSNLQSSMSNVEVPEQKTVQTVEIRQDSEPKEQIVLSDEIKNSGVVEGKDQRENKQEQEPGVKQLIKRYERKSQQAKDGSKLSNTPLGHDKQQDHHNESNQKNKLQRVQEQKPKQVSQERQTQRQEEKQIQTVQIMQTLQQPLMIQRQPVLLTVSQPEHQNQEPSKNHSQSGTDNNLIKKSIKQPFSGLLTKPLQYSGKSLSDDHKVEVSQKVNEVLKNHEDTKIEGTDNKEGDQQKFNPKQQLKIKIDQADSQKYISQQQLEQRKVQGQKQTKKQQKQLLLMAQKQGKAPQSETSKQKGPKSDMDKAKIKPRQQEVPKDTRQACKCLIY